MPPKDPERRRQQTREAVKRHSVKRGTTVARLAEQVQDAAGLPDPPSREFLLKALGVQAMEGNVPAIRLLLEEYRRDASTEEAQDPFADFDGNELAQRRQKRAATSS